MDRQYPELPPEVSVLDLLISAPERFGVAETQLTKVRMISVELHSTLIDASTAVRKAHLTRRLGGTEAECAAAHTAVAQSLERAALARAHADSCLRQTLSPEQLDRVTEALNAAPHNPIAQPDSPSAVPKDQKVVEIETATLVAERVIAWAKLFAWAVAVPAALLVAILTVIGISKFSDFTSYVAESEHTLRSTVDQAVTNADVLAQQVADLSRQQVESERQVATLSRELRSVTEKLGFEQGTTIAPEAQKQLQSLFERFRDYVVSLGYSPKEGEIVVKVLTDDSAGSGAYYGNGTIFVEKSWAKDPQIIYREYLHHVLYSPTGPIDVGPQKSALESGIADYLVASYAGSPKLYGVALSTPFNLDTRDSFRPARGHEDRFELGRIWASIFWQLRQALTRQVVDKAVFAAWFELGRDRDDQSIPAAMVAGFVTRAAGNDRAAQATLRKILQDRGAPLPGS